jgi:hypothetical protein
MQNITVKRHISAENAAISGLVTYGESEFSFTEELWKDIPEQLRLYIVKNRAKPLSVKSLDYDVLIEAICKAYEQAQILESEEKEREIQRKIENVARQHRESEEMARRNAAREERERLADERERQLQARVEALQVWAAARSEHVRMLLAGDYPITKQARDLVLAEFTPRLIEELPEIKYDTWQGLEDHTSPSLEALKRHAVAALRVPTKEEQDIVRIALEDKVQRIELNDGSKVAALAWRISVPALNDYYWVLASLEG